MSIFPASYVDGVTAIRHWATVTLRKDGIRVSDAEGRTVADWPWSELRVVDDEGTRGPIRLARGAARVTVEAPGFAAALYAAAPPLRPPRASRRLGRMLAAIAGSFAAIGGIWWSLPALSVLMVALIPVDAEERLGDRGLASLPLVACKNDAGQAALDRLVRRLTEHTEMRLRPKAIAGQFDVRGGDKIVNAFALPGGRIVVLRGLIDEAESADEVAGILSHELTHAIKRHGLRRLFAQAGFGVLFQTILGYGYTSDTGEFFASLSFTRAEEREADAGGIELLRQAGISTAGFAAFFKRLAAHVQGEAPALLQNHPATAERIAAVEAAASAATSPALSPEDWNALKHICHSTPR